MKAKLLLPVLAALIGGCATPEQRAEELAGYISENYGPTCVKLGYAAGTDSHRNCMVSMYNADQLRYSLPVYRGRRW
jgi:hypothetical protein